MMMRTKLLFVVFASVLGISVAQSQVCIREGGQCYLFGVQCCRPQYCHPTFLSFVGTCRNRNHTIPLGPIAAPATAIPPLLEDQGQGIFTVNPFCVGQFGTCGGFVGATCCRPDNECRYFPNGASYGQCVPRNTSVTPTEPPRPPPGAGGPAGIVEGHPVPIPTPAVTTTPVPTSSSSPANNEPSNNSTAAAAARPPPGGNCRVGAFCGGIANIQCCTGFACQFAKCNRPFGCPDQGGQCVPRHERCARVGQTCETYEGIRCCREAGLYCDRNRGPGCFDCGGTCRYRHDGFGIGSSGFFGPHAVYSAYAANPFAAFLR